MKTSLEKVSELQRKLNINVPAEIVNTTLEKLLKGIQKEAHIKGFRQGKAPLNTIKSVYGDKVKQDLAQELIQTHYYKALDEHAIEPINYPEFEFDIPVEGKDFSFSAQVEVKPEIVLKKYTGLKVEKEKYSFDQSRLDMILDNIRNSKAEQVTVLEDRPAQNGDLAIIDFEGYVDGKPLAGGTGTDHNLELGAKQFIDGFEDGVVGMKVGSQKTLNLKFPEQYHAADLSGKNVEFKVTLKSLKKKVLPELTDELLKSIGSNDTVESLKETIKKDIEASETRRIEQDLKNNLLKKLVSENPVNVPASLLKDQKRALVEDFRKQRVNEGWNESQLNEYSQKWDKDFESVASEMVQAGFLIDAIAKKHDLTWTKEDLDKKIQEFVKQTGLEEQKVKEFYSKPEQMQRLSYMITEDKVIGFLLSSAELKEVEKKKN